MARIEVFPFAPVGASGERCPTWIRELDGQNGVYLIRVLEGSAIAYVGESHSGRLYGTLTRHFQRWSPAYDTAGPTYLRQAVEVAAMVVPKRHASYLQNELICALAPLDNRLVCDSHKVEDEDEEDDRPAPRGYHYDIDELIAVLFAHDDDPDDIPF